jgi:tetratricopeptide (TPR) repeat protein
MRTVSFLFCSISFLVLSSAKATESPSLEPSDTAFAVAVSQFETSGAPENLRWLGRSFSDAVIELLFRTGKVRIVEREFLEKLVKEQKLQASGLVDERSAVTLGDLVGANTFVFGTVSLLGDDIIVKCRIVSVETGRVLGVAEAKGKKEDLAALQQQIARTIASTLAPGFEYPSAPASSAVSLDIQSNFEKMRLETVGLPVIGLDPARSRKLADYEVWINICNKTIQAQPAYAPAYYYRALFNLQSGEPDRAEKDCLQAVSLKMPGVEPLLLHANIEAQQKRFQEALAVLKKAANSFPSDSRPWYAIGFIQTQLNDPSSAIEALLASLQKIPFLDVAESNLRSLVGVSGNLRGLLSGMDTARLTNALAVYQSYWNGSMEVDREAALTVTHDYPNLYLGYYALGLSDIANNKFGNALTNFEEALKLRPAFPEVHREIGRLLLNQGKCVLGKAHVELYLQTAEYVQDFGALQKLIDGCHNN